MYKSLVLLFFTLLYSCGKEEPPASVPYAPFPSRGFAIEYYTGNPVPRALIAIVKPGIFGSTVITSFNADTNGEFNIQPSWSDYVINANDPDPLDNYVYLRGIGEVRGDSLVCTMAPCGWIRYYVQDSLPLNPEITEISHGPATSDGSMQYSPAFYPSQYNMTEGYVQPATAYQNYSIPIKFITGNDGISGNDSLTFVSIFTLRFDTLDVFITY